jgi:sec-independent protein translocase protein TatA
MPINMQGWEWVILILLALLIFGGSKLAGAGKNAGRAIREFREETRQIKADEERAKAEEAARKAALDAGQDAGVVDAELIEEPSPEQKPDA